jgi:hypothetical protein
MNQHPRPRAPAHYELRIEGHLDEHWSAWFGGLTLTREDHGTTILRGVVSDQAELHGLLAKVRDLGAILISVKVTEPITTTEFLTNRRRRSPMRSTTSAPPRYSADTTSKPNDRKRTTAPAGVSLPRL